MPSPTRRTKSSSPPPSDVRNVIALEDWYRIESVMLGGGAFSTVYRARRRTPPAVADGAEGGGGGGGEEEESFAIKIADKSARADAVLQQECHMLRHITRHRVPKCAHLVEALQTPECWALVLRTLPGTTDASTLVRRWGALNEWAAASVVRQLLTAVAALHDVGVVHRDISLGNVILGGAAEEAVVHAWLRATTDGSAASADDHGGSEKKTPRRPPEVLLIDFGFARQVTQGPIVAEEGGATGRPMRAYTPCGSVRYLPLEVLDMWTKGDGKGTVTTAERVESVDVYAVGVVAHVLLSGNFPFGGSTKREIVSQQRAVGHDLCTSRSWKDTSEAAKGLVRGLMDNNVSRRPKARQALAHEWLKGDGNKV